MNSYRYPYLKYIVVQLLICMASTTTFSQEIKKTQDLGAWLGVSLKHDFKKDYTLTFSQDVRLLDNLRGLDECNTDVGLNYKINKNFKLGANLRYSLNKKKDKTSSHDLRYNLDLKYKNKIADKFKVKYRFRYQNVYQNVLGKKYKGTKANIRNRIKLEYDYNKVHTPYVSTELFREIVTYRKPYFNALRCMVGDDVNTKFGDFNFAIAYVRELNSDYPLHVYFGKLTYTIDI